MKDLIYFSNNENVPLLKCHSWHTLNVAKGNREKQVQRTKTGYCKPRLKVIQKLLLDYFKPLYDLILIWLIQNNLLKFEKFTVYLSVIPLSPVFRLSFKNNII